MRNVLVIGGSRFIGYHLLEKLKKDDYSITVFNNDSRMDAQEKVCYIHGDRREKEKFISVFRKRSFDVVFDTCGFNEQDAQIVIEAFKDRVGRYVVCSTISVYDFYRINYFPVLETFPLKDNPESSDFEMNYGSHKVLFEKKLLANPYFPITIIRPTYVYGPYAYDYRLEYFLDRIIDGRKILMPAPVHNVLHFIHVNDLADLFMTAAIKNGEDGAHYIYNAAGNETTTIYNLIRICNDILGKEAEITVFDQAHLSSLLTEEDLRSISINKLYPYSLYFSNKKAVDELGWVPKISLDQGLRQTIGWYRNHREEPDYGIDDKVLGIPEAR